MAALPDGVELMFDQAFEQGTDEGSVVLSDESSVHDFHQEAYPAYVAPHRRGHNVQPGDHMINFKNRKPGMGEDPDKIQGVDNDKYQRLKLRVNFAMPKKVLDFLKPQFPGIYFHCADNGNHDHPISHVVTQIGTRFLQRRIPAGSRILDVYGNPNACERFNRSQANADRPKQAQALVWNFGGADFIREANKWGPIFDTEQGDEPRYLKSTLRDAIDFGMLSEFNVLQMVHTLYYEDKQTICDALHAPGQGTRRLLALVHRHQGKKGSINGGEQTYVVNDGGLVKQTNVITNSTYVHYNVSDWLFAETKEWFPRDEMMYADKGRGEKVQKRGMAWDVHMVNEETWIVEIVPMVRNEDDSDNGAIDFGALWDLSIECSEESDTIVPEVKMFDDTKMMLPTLDGKFVELRVHCKPLLQKLRGTCVGRERNAKLVAELVKQAQHLVNPSALFGDKPGLDCPEEDIYDHVIAAILSDAGREASLLQAVTKLQPVLASHMRSLKMGYSFSSFSFYDLVGVARSTVAVTRAVNRTVRHKDPVETGLAAVDGWLQG